MGFASWRRRKLGKWVKTVRERAMQMWADERCRQGAQLELRFPRWERAWHGGGTRSSGGGDVEGGRRTSWTACHVVISTKEKTDSITETILWMPRAAAPASSGSGPVNENRSLLVLGSSVCDLSPRPGTVSEP